MKHRIVALLVLSVMSVTLVYAGATYGQGGHGTGDGRFGMIHDHLERFFSKLEITGQQEDRIHEIFQRNHEDLVKDATTLAAAHEELITLIHRETFDEAAVRSGVEKASSILEELVIEAARIVHQVRGVLTPEQRDKAEAMLKELHSQHGMSDENGKGCLLDKLKAHFRGK